MFFGPPRCFFNLYVDLEKNLVTIFKQKNHCDKECESQRKYPIEYVLLNPLIFQIRKSKPRKVEGLCRPPSCQQKSQD